MIIFIEIPVQDMLVAVVAPARVLIVGLSVFVPTTMPLPIPGLMAPPYHLNQLFEILFQLYII